MFPLQIILIKKKKIPKTHDQSHIYKQNQYKSDRHKQNGFSTNLDIQVWNEDICQWSFIYLH